MCQKSGEAVFREIMSLANYNILLCFSMAIQCSDHFIGKMRQ